MATRQESTPLEISSWFTSDNPPCQQDLTQPREKGEGVDGDGSFLLVPSPLWFAALDCLLSAFGLILRGEATQHRSVLV